jgi:hypothetical protein
MIAFSALSFLSYVSAQAPIYLRHKGGRKQPNKMECENKW